MTIDPEYLRRHYASMSDEALLEVDREELVDEARKCYDAELAHRELTSSEDEGLPAGEVVQREPAGDEDEPEWLEYAAEVFSRINVPGVPAEDVADARDVLRRAGIPCHVDIIQMEPEQPKSAPAPKEQWRVLVPGDLNMHASSVLERDIFNQDFEDAWRTHLEALSDTEVRGLHPNEVFCGLFDKVARLNRVYKEEVERRRLK